ERRGARRSRQGAARRGPGTARRRLQVACPLRRRSRQHDLGVQTARLAIPPRSRAWRTCDVRSGRPDQGCSIARARAAASEPTHVLVHGFAGYGIQFNQHEYADISVQAGVTNANVTEMEQKVIALQPQFVRLFFDPSEFLLPDRMASFVRTAELAQRAGATT